MSTYRTCAVPMCGNTTIRYPKKLFIHVPKCPKRRKQWLQLARRDPMFTSDKSVIFFCEDHFDLPNDMENYIKYSIMGSVGKIRMKPDCLPSKFECQPDRIKRTAPPRPRSAVSKKRRRMDVIQNIFSKEAEIPATSGMTSSSDFQSTTEKDECSTITQDQATQVCPETTNKLVQVCLASKIRSKATQTTSQAKNKNTSIVHHSKNVEWCSQSVSSKLTLSKQDVIKTKQIASLRIKIERVIRHLREFSMLKPHSVVNKTFFKHLDDCVVIACALINLQDGIIINT